MSHPEPPAKPFTASMHLLRDFFLKTGHVFVTFLLLLADKKWICQSKPQVKKLKSLFSSPGTYLALRIQITEYPQLCSLILK